MQISIGFSGHGIGHGGFQLGVQPFETVGSLRNKIQRRTGIPASQINLFFNGYRLDDSETLSFYDISSGKGQH